MCYEAPRLGGEARGVHYHLLLIDEDGERAHGRETFATQAEAERVALAIVFEKASLGWRAIRYPGRTWRQQEVAVYLDRQHPGRRSYPCLELTVVRCEVDGDTRPPGCYLHGRRAEREDE